MISTRSFCQTPTHLGEGNWRCVESERVSEKSRVSNRFRALLIEQAARVSMPSLDRLSFYSRSCARKLSSPLSSKLTSRWYRDRSRYRWRRWEPWCGVVCFGKAAGFCCFLSTRKKEGGSEGRRRAREFFFSFPFAALSSLLSLLASSRNNDSNINVDDGDKPPF